MYFSVTPINISGCVFEPHSPVLSTFPDVPSCELPLHVSCFCCEGDTVVTALRSLAHLFFTATFPATYQGSGLSSYSLPFTVKLYKHFSHHALPFPQVIIPGTWPFLPLRV